MGLKFHSISLAAFLLSGCAATVISGSPRSVVIGKIGVLSQEEAQPLARAHCADYGKQAELQHAGTRDMYFRCVGTSEGEERKDADQPAE